ncbi:MAG: hypothetical protein OIF34_02795, partial [Porticoccaceae bacterium]|nr:hypothetical protein [Porticoccaceae bacterium]
SEAYDHPVWKKLISLGKVSQDIGDAHANLDFVMLWRIIYCLRNGLPLDQNVYDAAAWSVPNILSMQSVESRGKPVDFPDFTRGVWQNTGPLEVVL